MPLENLNGQNYLKQLEENKAKFNAASSVVGSVLNTAKYAVDSTRQRNAQYRQMQENKIARQAQQQQVNNERLYNSPFSQSMRMKDAGFNPNAFMQQISPTASAQPAPSEGAELPYSQNGSMDVGDSLSGFNQMASDMNDVLIAQMNIQSQQKIAADNVELEYWRTEVNNDTRIALQKTQQEHEKSLQARRQDFEKSLQESMQAHQANLQKMAHEYETVENEKDRSLSRERLSQEYLQFRENLEEQIRVNDAQMSALRTKMSIAKQENARAETRAYYDAELASLEKQAKTLQNALLQYENDVAPIKDAVDMVGDIVGMSTGMSKARTYERQVEGLDRRDRNAEKAKRYDANRRYQELINEGYSPAKAKEKVEKEFGFSN